MIDRNVVGYIQMMTLIYELLLQKTSTDAVHVYVPYHSFLAPSYGLDRPAVGISWWFNTW